MRALAGNKAGFVGDEDKEEQRRRGRDRNYFPASYSIFLLSNANNSIYCKHIFFFISFKLRACQICQLLMHESLSFTLENSGKQNNYSPSSSTFLFYPTFSSAYHVCSVVLSLVGYIHCGLKFNNKSSNSKNNFVKCTMFVFRPRCCVLYVTVVCLIRYFL